MRAWLAVAFAVSLGLACFMAGRWSVAAPEPEVRIDTVEVFLPSMRAEVALETREFRVPTICIANFSGERSVEEGESEEEPDSALVRLPIVSRQYAAAEYEAWVSGPLDPRLDSLRIIRRIEVPSSSASVKGKGGRWHLGLSVGAAVTPKGFQPYAGVSITYSLKEF